MNSTSQFWSACLCCTWTILVTQFCILFFISFITLYKNNAADQNKSFFLKCVFIARHLLNFIGMLNNENLNNLSDIFFLTLSIISMLCSSFFHLIPEAFQMASYNFTNSLSVWEYFTLGCFAMMGMVFVVIVHTLLDFVHFYYQFQTAPSSCVSKNKSLTKIASFSSIKDSSSSHIEKNKKGNEKISSSHDSCTAFAKHACHVPLKILLKNTKNFSSTTDLQDTSRCHKIKRDHELIVAHTTLLSSALHNIVDGLFVGITHKTSYQHQSISTGVTLFFHELPSQITNVILLKRAGYPDFDACLLNLLATGTFYCGVLMIYSGISGENHFGLHIATASNFLTQALTIIVPELLNLFSFHSLVQVIMYKETTYIQEILTCILASFLGFLSMIGLLYYEHN